MSLESWKDSCRRLVEEMKPMTFQEKAEHIWTYYKEHLFLIGMGLLLIVAIVGSSLSANREVFLAGMCWNVDINPDGYSYLTNDYFAKMGGDSAHQDISLSTMDIYVSDNMTQNQVDTAYDSIINVTALVEAKMLDYVLTTGEIFSYFLGQEYFMDLREFLTPEELVHWEDKLVYVRVNGEDGEQEEKYPVAIDITQLSFTKDCIEGDGGPVYLCIIVNTPRVEQCRQMWAEIQAWESKNQENAA